MWSGGRCWAPVPGALVLEGGQFIIGAAGARRQGERYRRATHRHQLGRHSLQLSQQDITKVRELPTKGRANVRCSQLFIAQ